MATSASPRFDRSFGRPALPLGSRPDNTSIDPQHVGIIWQLPRPEMPAARQTAPAAAARLQAATRPPTTPPPTRPTSLSAPPPDGPPPTQPAARRPGAPKPSRRAKELTWLTWQLSTALRQQTARSLRETLRWRASECEPLPPPARPIERSRFGLRGEQLVPQADKTVCDLLAAELREIVRMVEAPLSWSQRNYRLVMHSTRLGQLCANLERRGSVDVLEVICAGLEPLWN